MRQKIYYVSRDPAHAAWWIVAAAAMRPISFHSRGEALTWATQQAQDDETPELSVRVLLQTLSSEWISAYPPRDPRCEVDDPLERRPRRARTP